VPYNPYLHISLQFLNLALALESEAIPRPKQQIPNASVTVPPKDFPAEEIEAYCARLAEDFPALISRRLVLVYPGGGILPIRAWPHAYYLELCQGMVTEGYAVGIIGLKSYRDGAQRLVAQCASPLCVDMSGYTRSIRELLLLFQNSALLVTNDGGPGHFAALTQIPSIVLFGPETPVLYGSLARKAHFFFTRLSCSPCLSAYNHRTSPCDGDNQCLKSIRVNQVLTKARELLATAPD
jgi:ADP-heptose:LPS heptosyltransferase